MNETNLTRIALNWLHECNNQNAPSTISKYEQLICNYINPYFQDLNCRDLTQERLQNFYVSLNERRKKNFLSDNTKRTIIMLLNNVLEYAYQSQFLNEKMYLKPCLSKSRPLVRIFTMEEQRKLETYLLSHHTKYAFAVYLALYTGIRIGEICALKWDDFNFTTGSLQIVRTVQRLKTPDDNEKITKTKLVITCPKSYASYRIIPLQDFVLQQIETLYPTRELKKYIFTGEENSPMEPRSLQYAYKRILSEAGISYLNFHCLRHTFATRCINCGWDMKTLSEILGHSDIKITMEYYFHSSFEFKKIQMNKLLPLS